jgi:inner membrane protein
VNTLNQERRNHRAESLQFTVEVVRAAPPDEVFDAYRMVERALKHGVLVLALVFTAFFLFETLAGLRLHAVHYGLVGAALCLFYLALLALGEVMRPEGAYAGAAVASSLLITLYSGSILRRWGRAALIGGLLAGVHSVLFVVLRLEAYALLAGTGALFAALAAVMYFTRNIDWAAQDAGHGAVAGPEVVQ